MRIYWKLVIAFLVLSMISMLFIGYATYYNAKDSLQKEIFHTLNTDTEHELNYHERRNP